jgi:uncharacterized membrane protein YebE (DUF533 family)
MFDASILDALVRGGGQPQGSGSGQGMDAFRDLLGQLAGPGAQPPTQRPMPQADPRGPTGGYDDDQPDQRGFPRGGYERGAGPQDAPDQSGGISLEDLLRSVLGGGQPGQQGPGGGGGPGFPGGGSLQDILREVLGGGRGGPMNRMVGDGGQGGNQTDQGGPGAVLDALRQVLGQATSGVREGADRLDDMTGASARARDAIGQATGQSPEELIAKLRELVGNNQLGAGAALGGLGALILGTQAGRSLAGTAVKLGGLALIGGLAYKAYQNYQQGLPPLAGGNRQSTPQGLVAAPSGSGFEPDAVTHDSALLYVRAMIAAAAADGRIDSKEQQKILGGLQQAGLDQTSQQFLAREINNPATVEDLAAAVSSEQEALQVYTAARIAVDVDSDAEHDFLDRLAQALGIDDALAAQVDAAARSAG